MDIVKITDGLGNQMFQYAFARSHQISSGHKVCLYTGYINNEDIADFMGEKVLLNNRREYKLDRLKITLECADEKMMRYWRYLWNNDWVSTRIKHLAENKRWFYNYTPEKDGNVDKSLLPSYYIGYFFDLKYYRSIKNELVKEFEPKDEIILDETIKNELENSNVVSVHFRRTDFLRFGRDISSSDYYKKAIERISAAVKNPVFFVFSDDIKWVKENIRLTYPAFFISDMGYEDYEELYIMRKCRHFIIANSTFSYWGAYLGEKEGSLVIAPADWRKNIYPGHWTLL